MTEHLPTLRFRLALRAFLYALAVSLFIGGAAWFAVGGVITDRIETEAEDYLATLTGELTIATSPTDPNVVAPVNQAIEDRAAQVIDMESGEVVVSTPGLPALPLIDPSLLIEDTTVTVELAELPDAQDELLVKATVLVVDSGRFGVVAGVYNNSPLDDPAVILATAGVALMISIGLGVAVWMSVRSALGPVETLANEADRVASAPESQNWAVPNVATTAEIYHLIERLNSLVDRVHQSRERERVFLEDASHDLRTPIAVARAELDLARGGTLEPETRQALDSAIEELDRLDSLAADLLILARMRAEPDRSAESVHLGHLVRRAAARLVRGPGHQNLTVTVEGQAEVQGDPVNLDRAIDNVLTNAFRHASTEVAIELTQSTSEARLQISDDGPGFPEPILANATERFTRDPANLEGTGLGLAISSAIVEAHGGRLECANRADGGATVALHLPVFDEDTVWHSPSAMGP